MSAARVLAGVVAALLTGGESRAQSARGEQAMDAEPATRAEPAGMLRIPGGRLTFGADATGASVHEVVVRPFWMDRTEVDVGAYQACVAAGRCALPARTSPLCTFALGDPALPVSCVNHSAASRFCTQRGARLPTEAEWEFAAKGISQRPFPWGDAGSACAVAATLRSDNTAKSCSGVRPARVGTHPRGRSPFGLDDMAGNLEEWTADYFVVPLPAVPPQAGSSFVLRGGSWLLGPSYAKTTARSSGSIMEAGPGVGFRCAKGA